MSGVSNYPHASREDLKAQYVGRRLQEVAGPAAVLDVAVTRQNCQVMLDAAESLGVQFRSHVKTHKVGIFSHQFFELDTPSWLLSSCLN